MSVTDPMPSLARPTPSQHLLVAVLWLAVGLPAAWGLYRTAVNATPLFHHPAGPPAATR